VRLAKKVVFFLVFLCALVACVSAELWAQSASTGAISGIVRDTSRSVIPGASVKLTNIATGTARTVVTDGTGSFTFSLLPPGDYSAVFTAMGFKVATTGPVTVNVTETTVVNITMEVGAQAQTVTVNSQAEVLQTESTTLGGLVGSKEVMELPLATRNYTQILALFPGVVGNVNNANTLGRGSLDVVAGGNTQYSNSYQMDGADINNYHSDAASDYAGGTAAGIAVPSPDAIQEFKVQTSMYDASYGRTSGANVDVVTKSGTNAFHGDLFEFLRNTDLDANDFFLKRAGRPRPVLDQNQFGGTFGGPIRKDKIFFFGSYQGTRQENGVSSVTNLTTLPPLTNDRSAGAIGSLFCGGPTAGRDVYGPSRTPEGVAVACDGSNINPAALAILNLKVPGSNQYYIPTPQTIVNGLGSETFSIPATFNEDQYLVNTDYVLSPKNTLSEKFFYGNDSTVTPAALSPTPFGEKSQPYKNILVPIKLTSTLTPSLVNELKAAYVENFAKTTTINPFTNTSLNITPLNPYDPRLVQLSIVGGTPTFTIGAGNSKNFSIFDKNFEAGDQISWLHGKHTIRSGFDITRAYQNNFISATSGAVTFSSIQGFLLGMPAGTGPGENGTTFSNVAASSGNISRPVGSPHEFQAENLGAFLQDDFKITPSLTLNLGVRWEYFGGLWDSLGDFTNVWQSLVNLAPIPPAAGTYVGWTVSNNYPGTVPLPPGVLVRPHSWETPDAPQRANFAPRLGFAWQPLGTGGHMVIRGGYGIFFDRMSVSLESVGNLNTPPFNTQANEGGQITPTSTLQAPFPLIPSQGFPLRTQTSALGGTAVDDAYKTPAVQEYSLGVQYQLPAQMVLDVGYSGSHATHIPEIYPLEVASLASPSNPVNCGLASGCVTTTTSAAANVLSRYPYVGFAALSTLATDGTANYNALLASLKKNVSRSVSFQASYTYSRNLTPTSSYQGNTLGTNILRSSNDPLDPAQQYGPADFDRTNRLVVTALWTIPNLAKGNRVGRTLLNGWSISEITTIQSGLPLTLTDSRAGSAYFTTAVAVSSLGGITPRANLCPGYTVGQIETPGSVGSRINDYFNKAAFCAPPLIPTALGGDGIATGFSNLRRGVVRGPDQDNTDLSLLKNTRVGGLREDAQLQFRADFFNSFNTPQFSIPVVANPYAANFGQITSLAVAPRIVQFSLKYIF
jgi:hypothetical protein